MAYTPKRLYTGQPASTATTLYTAPASTTTIIKSITMVNTTAGSANVSVSIVPSGDTASTANRIISSLPLAGNATVMFENIGMMNTGDFISALQGTTSAISVHISGVEVT